MALTKDYGINKIRIPGVYGDVGANPGVKTIGLISPSS